MKPALYALGIAAFLVTALAGAAEPGKPFSPDQLQFYDKEVRPILQAHCYKCHGEGKVKGGLRLTGRATLLKGGDTGPAVNPDKPEASLILKVLSHEDDLRMPPNGKLPPDKLDVLTRWVKMGAPMPAGSDANQTAAPGRVTPEARNYWAYRPVKRPEVPKVRNAAWVKSPVDAFILAPLEAKGLQPATPADKVALVRRAYFDLTGLPPTPEQVDAFLADASPRAYENLLDRLLDSPQYGEKWGRHWLDLVRYAETNGYERDGPKPFAWRYRDYVIKSFNADKPYDQFIREQLAGDELPYSADAVTATGYYRLGIWDDEPADPAQARYDELDDIVATTSQVFLAMTMNCARCHDHKIDPLSQADYYRLLAFFQDVQRYSNNRNPATSTTLADISPPEVRARYEAEQRKNAARIDELARAMKQIEEEGIRKMPAEDQRAAEGPERPRILARKLRQFLSEEQNTAYRKLKTEHDGLRNKPSPHQELALSVHNNLVNPPATHVLIRGNPHSPGAAVTPAFPEVLGFAAPTLPAPAKEARSSGRRTVLANWVASPDNPLTARVFVNRLWQHHFGRGLVPSSNDFGKFGTPPTHPELLDWLAAEFMTPSPQPSPPGGGEGAKKGQPSPPAGGEGAGKGQPSPPGGGEGRVRGWSVKRMHKLLMLSQTYQMSARADDKALRLDPANNLFWRFNPRRLTAEEVRDAVLSVSGKLNLKAGGPSIYPPIPREVLAGQSRPGEGWHLSPPDEACRRSVYVHVKRSLLVPVLSQHDQADTDSSCPVRYTTTVPTQSLGMLNGDFSNEQAAAFAGRLRREAPGDLAAQIRRAIRLTTARNPAEEEVRRDVAFVREVAARNKVTEDEALRHYGLLLLNTNEFMYLD